ncbi:hypothetical protein [Mycobacterium sp. E3339]|uniref:hypothetical protein n=1 Tax=Mycobacterium sp. E3339 TaxID=1834146 RepID=UPI0012E7CCEB|nr:hypothetical protein [Mycobacterium sp. E3339]
MKNIVSAVLLGVALPATAFLAPEAHAYPLPDEWITAVCVPGTFTGMDPNPGPGDRPMSHALTDGGCKAKEGTEILVLIGTYSSKGAAMDDLKHVYSGIGYPKNTWKPGTYAGASSQNKTEVVVFAALLSTTALNPLKAYNFNIDPLPSQV